MGGCVPGQQRRAQRGSGSDRGTRGSTVPAAQLSIEAFLSLSHRADVLRLGKSSEGFVGSDVLHRCGDPPDVAEWVPDPAASLTESLGEWRRNECGAGVERCLCRRIGVSDENP